MANKQYLHHFDPPPLPFPSPTPTPEEPDTSPEPGDGEGELCVYPDGTIGRNPSEGSSAAGPPPGSDEAVAIVLPVTINSITLAEGQVARFTMTNTSDELLDGEASIVSGSAGADDYNGWAAASFSIKAGGSKSIVVRTVDDDLVEGTETFAVMWTSGGGTVTGTGTIIDND